MMSPELFMTKHVIGLVEDTFSMLDKEWHQHWQTLVTKGGMSASHHRREMKTIRVLLPRRSGITTAATLLWDAHPNALMYFPNYQIRDEFLRQHQLPRDNNQVRVLPQTIDDLKALDGRNLFARTPRDLVIFDGVTRMKHTFVEEACHYHDPYTKLFVLLG